MMKREKKKDNHKEQCEKEEEKDEYRSHRIVNFDVRCGICSTLNQTLTVDWHTSSVEQVDVEQLRTM